MPKKNQKVGNPEPSALPKVILLRSENTNIDGKKRSEEIQYYLTHVILLADKKGRPSKDSIPEVTDAA